MTEKQNVLHQLYNDTKINKKLFVGHCEPDQAPLRMHSLRRAVPNTACWGHMQPTAVMKHSKSCLSALALLIVYDIFSEQACDVCLPTKLCINITKKTRLKKEPRFKCFSKKLGGAGGGGGLQILRQTLDVLTEHLLSLCLPCNSIIHHNGTSWEGGSVAGSKWVEKCFSGGPPKNLTKWLAGLHQRRL